ncbi:hypothetical protein QQ045_022264 [Rhodiola kirilowii]
MEAAICNELEEIKAELEQVKVELNQSLREAHDDRIGKSQMEKRMEEICVKSAEKVEILEGANREFVSALDDVIAQNKKLEGKLRARNKENDGLKALLLATERKCSEAEKKTAFMSNELSCKEQQIARLEDEFKNVEDNLKWKNERFNFLEEAHEKLRSEFQSSRLEWEKERSVLLGKISSLQSSFDSQTRISNCLQTKLKMCDQALTHEESRRKLIEIQLSESQTLFENIYAKCQEEQAKVGQLTAQRDEEIANLRYLLATKDILFKDMEIKNLELKQQKEDVLGLLEDFQEAEIKSAASFRSLTKVQEKLQNLEQVHGSCSIDLELKEMEWMTQFERLKAEIKEHLSELKYKETVIHDLRKELEMCQFSLQVLNEEKAIIVMVLKSEYSEACSKLLGEHENNQYQINMLITDLEDRKNMLEESLSKQRQLEEHVLEINKVNKVEKAEITHERNLISAELQKWKNDAEVLKSSFEEAQNIHKQAASLLELQLENEQASKQEIDNLTTLVKEHERNIGALQQQMTSLKSAMALKDDALEVLELNNKSYIGMIEELESKNIHLNDTISGLVIGWQNILGEMEGASNQLHEICCEDESLLSAFRITEFASVNNEHELCNGISNHNKRNEAVSFTATAAKLQTNTKERLPLREINY